MIKIPFYPKFIKKKMNIFLINLSFILKSAYPRTLRFARNYMGSECPETILSNNTKSDAILVQQTCAGDQHAFTELWNRYRGRIYRVIYFMVHNEEDSWDLLQDTFIKAYQALPSLKNAQILGSWLTRIAMNLAINHIKKRERSKKHQDELIYNLPRRCCESPQQTLEQQEFQEKLHNIIAQLPPKQRSVLILSDIEEYSYKEIAEVLQCRIGTVMSRLFYARNCVRNQLGTSMPEEETPLNTNFLSEGIGLEEEWDAE